MRIPSLFRNLFLGLTTSTFALAGAALAQSPAPAQWDLVGATVRLDHALSTKNAQQGQAVEAKLEGSVKTADGVDLPKGTELVGQIDRVQASENGGPSALSVVFTRAALKDGHTIPVKVTVIGAYPADEESLSVDGDQTMGPAPRHVNPQEQVDQEAGMLRHISMDSAVQSSNSARFSKPDGDLTLQAGTFLQVGIARQNRNAMDVGE